MRKLQCPICKKEFAREFTLNRHIQSKPSTCIKPQDKLKCEFCEKSFSTKTNLTRHKNLHCFSKVKLLSELDTMKQQMDEMKAMMKQMMESEKSFALPKHNAINTKEKPILKNKKSNKQKKMTKKNNVNKPNFDLFNDQQRNEIKKKLLGKSKFRIDKIVKKKLIADYELLNETIQLTNDEENLIDLFYDNNVKYDKILAQVLGKMKFKYCMMFITENTKSKKAFISSSTINLFLAFASSIMKAKSDKESIEAKVLLDWKNNIKISKLAVYDPKKIKKKDLIEKLKDKIDEITTSKILFKKDQIETNKLSAKMMEDKRKIGYIYKISSSNCNKVYVGNTEKNISKRFCEHIAEFKRYLKNKSTSYCSSFEILQYDDDKVELLEEYSFIRKSAFNKRETFWINKLPTINIKKNYAQE